MADGFAAVSGNTLQINWPPAVGMKRLEFGVAFGEGLVLLGLVFGDDLTQCILAVPADVPSLGC